MLFRFFIEKSETVSFDLKILCGQTATRLVTFIVLLRALLIWAKHCWLVV
jgi:hypothetical protein